MPASAVSEAKSGARAVGLMATATRPSCPRSSRSSTSFCRPGATRLDQHRDELGEAGGVPVRLGVRMGVLAKKINGGSAAAAPELLELGSCGPGVGGNDELGRHPGDLAAGGLRYEPATTWDPGRAGEAPLEQPRQNVTAEVLLHVPVEVGIVGHSRQCIHEAEQLGPERLVRHRPPHEPLGAKRDPKGPGLGAAPELGDAGDQLSHLGLRRNDTRALVLQTSFRHRA